MTCTSVLIVYIRLSDSTRFHENQSVQNRQDVAHR